MAEVYDKAGERVVILDVREDLVYPFQAPDWLDLRVGFFLSLTDDTADDTITGLSETITDAFQAQDRYWIGVKTNNSQLPRTDGTSFIGFSNTAPVSGHVELVLSDTMLVSSDIGVGTTNANYWRPKNETNDAWSAIVLDGPNKKANTINGTQQHFVQNVAGAGGYAVLLGMRLERTAGYMNAIRISMKSTGFSGDLLYSSTPTRELLISSLETWTNNVQLMQPGPISVVPDALFLYWPFRNSRLRCHSVGIVKVA